MIYSAEYSIVRIMRVHSISSIMSVGSVEWPPCSHQPPAAGLLASLQAADNYTQSLTNSISNSWLLHWLPRRYNCCSNFSQSWGTLVTNPAYLPLPANTAGGRHAGWKTCIRKTTPPDATFPFHIKLNNGDLEINAQFLYRQHYSKKNNCRNVHSMQIFHL